MNVRHTALGTASVTVTASTSAVQVPDVLANSAQVTQTATTSPATVSGTVVDQNGAPVSQASVWVYRVGQPSLVVQGQTTSTGTWRERILVERSVATGS